MYNQFLFFSIFNVLYSIISIISNYIESNILIKQLLIDEIKTGVIAIRLTSITLGFAYVRSVFKLAKNTPFPNDEKKKEYLEYHESRKYMVTCQ